MEAAVAAGQYKQAESARLEAYAIFDAGPEKRLLGFAPQYSPQRIEELFWQGNDDHPGLADAIAKDASSTELRATRLALDKADSATPSSVLGRAAGRRRGDLQRRHDRLPRGAGGGPDPGIAAGEHDRRPTSGSRRRCYWGDRPRSWQPRRCSSWRARSCTPWPVRREGRGDRLGGRDRRSAAGHQLVLPQGLLDPLDRQAPHQAADADRRRGRTGARAWSSSGSPASSARARRPSSSSRRWCSMPERSSC